MMFYEFSEHELLMAKLLWNISNVQLIILGGRTEIKGIAFVIPSN